MEGLPRVEAWSLPQARDALTTLFQRFWLQLGWMAVPAPQGVYLALAVVTGGVVAGLGWRVLRVHQDSGLALPLSAKAMTILGLLLTLVIAQVLFYNLQFLQPQGRYLFPALTPIAIFFILGLQALVTPNYLLPAQVLIALGLLWVHFYALGAMVSFLAPA